jgi:TRAP-type C4-dicarboxylate transport system substrate-binding protein
MYMSVMTRRTVVKALALSSLSLQAPAWAQGTTLKISHQFPGGNMAEGDFRDRLCRMFAAEVEKRTKGALKFSIYPGSSPACARARSTCRWCRCPMPAAKSRK